MKIYSECYIRMTKATSMGCQKANNAFSIKGFSNRKNALANIATHDASNHYKTAMLEKMAPNQHRDLEETFYEVDAESEFQNRQIFLELLRNIRFFARQGIPLRGHEEKDGNFHQLLEMQVPTDQSVSD